jgi:hypothetical protein
MTPGQAPGTEVTRDPEIPVHLVQLRLCDPCLDGVGEQCHTPGCSLWIHDAPKPAIRGSQGVTILGPALEPFMTREDFAARQPNGADELPEPAAGVDPASAAYRVEAHAFNAVTRALAPDTFMPLSERQAVAQAVVAAIEPVIREDERVVAAASPLAEENKRLRMLIGELLAAATPGQARAACEAFSSAVRRNHGGADAGDWTGDAWEWAETQGVREAWREAVDAAVAAREPRPAPGPRTASYADWLSREYPDVEALPEACEFGSAAFRAGMAAREGGREHDDGG